jgi:hypothetical protein
MALFPGTPKEESQNCPKLSWFGFAGTLVAHNSLLRPPIGMRSKANLYLSLKDFQQCVALHLHTPGSVDSQLLVVGSQIANLTPSPSFTHKLCCRYLNGSCKAIFDIYTSRPFQRYKEHLKKRCFDPCNRVLSF